MRCVFGESERLAEGGERFWCPVFGVEPDERGTQHGRGVKTNEKLRVARRH